METNFKKGGQRHVKPLGTIRTTSKSSSGRRVYTKKKKEIKRRKKWKIKKKKVVYFYFNRTNELLRENNINVFLHFRPVEGFDFFLKKTVKMGEYPRQKSLIKYSTKLKTTLERNENEKHFHFFFFLWYKPSFGIIICLHWSLSAISFCCKRHRV